MAVAEINPAELASTVVWGGFALAFAFGWFASRANFCTMGAVADVITMGHWGRMRMWMLAIAVAIIGANLLFAFGLVDLSKSVYQRSNLSWLSMLLGGLLFGIGMTLSGGCANKNLLRAGHGSLRSLVVLVFLGLSAYMTLRGVLGQWRVTWLDPVAINLGAHGLKDQSASSIVAQLLGIDRKLAILATSAVIAVALLIFVFDDRRFRANARQVTTGTIIGALVAAGWYLTGHIGYGENPETLEHTYFATNSRTLESLSFVGPVAYTLELLLLWTDKSLHMSFGVATALGVILGSAAWALVSKTFHWEGFASLADLRKQLAGAVLMGFGGVTALGCTVGQGLSGVSTLAIGSFIALAGIISGAVITLKYLHWEAERED